MARTPEKQASKSPLGANRRSFLQTALAGGAAYLAIGSNMRALAATGPIRIGHHCELTGGFSSWGYWFDKSAKLAAQQINAEGGIAGRELELITEDTESSPATGARKLRSLIQREGASFVTGSVHSGVMLASIPVATELKTVYFSCGEATEAIGSHGTRYSFRTGMDTYSIAAAAAPWAYETLGKKWTIISPDYAWGHSHYAEHKAVIEKLGGQVAEPIFVPLGTTDLVPYLAKIPSDTEVLFSVFFGALSVAFYTQAKSMKLGERMKMYSVSGTVEAIAPADLDGAAEGVYIVENFPRMLKYKDDDAHREFNAIVGIDDVDARETDSERVNAKSHSWQAWENLYALKAAIEASGWKSKKDDQGVVEALEGLQLANSLAHPQGDKFIRKEDHSGMVDCYISLIEDDKFEVKKRVPKEEIAASLTPRVDLSQMPL